MENYHLEFILHVTDTPPEQVKNALAEFGENLDIEDCPAGQESGKDLIVRIKTEDPTVIFDICAQFGRIKSAKIEERS